MILVDSSAWIEFDRATGSSAHLALRALLELEPQHDLAVTEPIMMEVLAGAADDRRADDLRRLLQRATLLRIDAASDFDAAATTFRQCRSAGFTPRGLLDCLIAVVAWRHNAALLTWDRDLLTSGEVLGQQIEPASLPR